MDKKPRVLYLINYAGKAGTEKYVENLVKYLHPQKAECQLCFNVDGPLADKMRDFGIKVHRVEMKSPFDKKAAKQLAQICKEEQIDVIHAQYPRENFIAILSKKYYDKPEVIFTSHLTIYQNAIWKFFNKRYTKKDKAVISVCRQGKDILVSNGVAEDKIKVIYNGIDPSSKVQGDRNIFGDLATNEDTIFLILARLTEDKGLKFLCDCAKSAKTKTNKPFKVMICGDGEQKEELEAYIDQNGLNDQVKLLGFRTDTAELLASSDVYLNTSSANEAMSFAILESLAQSLPVIATDIGGSSDLVNEGGVCGYVTKFGDVEGFSSAMVELIENPQKRAQLGKVSYDKACSTFSLEKLLNDIYSLYV